MSENSINFCELFNNLFNEIWLVYILRNFNYEYEYDFDVNFITGHQKSEYDSCMRILKYGVPIIPSDLKIVELSKNGYYFIQSGKCIRTDMFGLVQVNNKKTFSSKHKHNLSIECYNDKNNSYVSHRYSSDQVFYDIPDNFNVKKFIKVNFSANTLRTLIPSIAGDNASPIAFKKIFELGSKFIPFLK